MDPVVPPPLRRDEGLPAPLPLPKPAGAWILGPRPGRCGWKPDGIQMWLGTQSKQDFPGGVQVGHISRCFSE